MTELPGWIKKIYIICSASESFEESCQKCPFFQLPEDRFFCADSRDLILERIKSEKELEEEEAPDCFGASKKLSRRHRIEQGRSSLSRRSHSE